MEVELLTKAREGDERALDTLYEKYKFKILKIANKYFLNDGGMEDLVQEGMLGFVKAINTYDETKGEFYPYLKKLVERQILNAIKKSNTLKNSPLNNRLNLNNQGEVEIVETGKVVGIPSDTLSPELNLLMKENKRVFDKKVNDILSPFEKQILKLYLSGYKYDDIIKELNVNYKSVDNALNRIKTKLQKTQKGE